MSNALATARDKHRHTCKTGRLCTMHHDAVYYISTSPVCVYVCGACSFSVRQSDVEQSINIRSYCYVPYEPNWLKLTSVTAKWIWIVACVDCMSKYIARGNGLWFAQTAYSQNLGVNMRITAHRVFHRTLNHTSYNLCNATLHATT